MKKKGLAIVALTTGLLLSNAFTSLAGWEQSEQGWKYKRENGDYLINDWYPIDGNLDRVAEWYHFDEKGIMSADEVIIEKNLLGEDEEWKVNENGARLDENGEVITQVCYDTEAAIELTYTRVGDPKEIELFKRMYGYEE